MATVASGNWQLPYGTHFDESVLKALPPGSVYSETGACEPFCTHYRHARHRAHLWFRS